MRRSQVGFLVALLCAGAGCAKSTSPDLAPLGGGSTSSGNNGSGGAGGEAGAGGAPADPNERCAGVDCNGVSTPCSIGRCDPADGVCKAVPIADATPCDDDDRCTSGDACFAGACTGAPADCSALDSACHVGACNPLNGSCSPVAVADGAACEDGSACTTGDTCSAGRCNGAAVDCSALDGVCRVGACDPADGTCGAAPAMTGSPCDDANPCSWADSCSAVSCAGAVLDCDPLGLGFPQASDTPIRGSSAEGEFLDDCPFGQVPIGIEASAATGASSGLLAGVATRCGAVSVAPTAAGVDVLIAPGARVPETGARGSATLAGAPDTQLCPANQVAVGFEGSTQGASGPVSQLALRCAPLSVTGSAGTGYAVAAGAAAAIPPVGTAAGTAIPATDCPTGTVARGAHLHAGAVLNGYGLRCGTPTLRLVTTAPRVATGGGGTSEDDCPEGQVPIGIEAQVADGFYYGTLSSFATRCGTIAVTATGGGFDVSVTPGARLPASGAHGWPYTGALYTATCAANQGVVGLSGTFGSFTEQLTLRCAPFTVSGDATTGYTVSVGAITVLPTVGTATGTPAPAHDCPAGMLGRGFYVNSGEILDGVALRCAPPLITPR